MTYWIGDKAAIEAANDAAFAKYQADNPTAECSGEIVPNMTTAWAVPAQTASGEWAIRAYPGIAAPDGVAETEAVVWPEAESPI